MATIAELSAKLRSMGNPLVAVSAFGDNALYECRYCGATDDSGMWFKHKKGCEWDEVDSELEVLIGQDAIKRGLGYMATANDLYTTFQWFQTSVDVLVLDEGYGLCIFADGAGELLDGSFNQVTRWNDFHEGIEKLTELAALNEEAAKNGR